MTSDRFSTRLITGKVYFVHIVFTTKELSPEKVTDEAAAFGTDLQGFPTARINLLPRFLILGQSFVAGATVLAQIGRRFIMLWTIAVVLLVLWALGLVSSYTMGGFIHILLVLAIVVVLVSVIQGRRPG